MSRKLNVVEIFKSIQGEGANFGMPCIFVRLAGCNLACSFCDTDWRTGEAMTIEQIQDEVKRLNCRSIVWTGGEPTLQLTAGILAHFSDYYNCIETNGTNPIPHGIDYISLSPKNAPIHISIKAVHEIRIPVANGDKVPNTGVFPDANRYYLSPIFDGLKLNADSLDYCLKIIGESKVWRLSIQAHKLLKIQ